MQVVSDTLAPVLITEVSLGMLVWSGTSPEVSVQFRTHSHLGSPTPVFSKSRPGEKDLATSGFLEMILGSMITEWESETKKKGKPIKVF